MYKNVSVDKIDDSVSYATSVMKYAKNPSGKTKTVL